jgi:hypothetical protein
MAGFRALEPQASCKFSHICSLGSFLFDGLLQDQPRVTFCVVLYTYVHSGYILIIPPPPEGGRGYAVFPLSIRPSVQDIFRRIFLSNC